MAEAVGRRQEGHAVAVVIHKELLAARGEFGFRLLKGHPRHCSTPRILAPEQSRDTLRYVRLAHSAFSVAASALTQPIRQCGTGARTRSAGPDPHRLAVLPPRANVAKRQLLTHEH